MESVRDPGLPGLLLRTERDALIRLLAGRPLTGTRYELGGANEKELVFFDQNGSTGR